MINKKSTNSFIRIKTKLIIWSKNDRLCCTNKKKKNERLSLWTSQINQNLAIGTINHIDSLTWLILEI